MAYQHIHEMSDADLNMAVAERVMGRRVQYLDPLPNYAQDVAAAWSVAEKLREGGWLVNVKAMPDDSPFYLDDDYRARLHRRYACSLTWMEIASIEGVRKRIHTHPWAWGDTMGQAICRVALEAIETD